MRVRREEDRMCGTVSASSSQSRRARRDMPPAPLEGHVSSQDHIIRARRAAGGFALRVSNETRHGSLLRETLRAVVGETLSKAKLPRGVHIICLLSQTAAPVSRGESRS